MNANFGNMNNRKTSIFKMISEIPEDRIIQTFPKPFISDCTEYNKLDFSQETISACDQSHHISTNFKICKVIILGDVAVGKTCIVNRFCRQIFDSNYKTTIGVDFEVERFNILSVPFNMQIWDTAGQERFRSIAQSYYRAAHVVLIVFDFTNLFSLSHSKRWLQDALDASGTVTPLIFLVGAKKDLISKVTYNSIKPSVTKVAKELLAEFWAISSKTGENLNQMFFRIAALAFDDYIKKEMQRGDISIKIASELVSFKNNSNKGNLEKQKCGIDCIRN